MPVEFQYDPEKKAAYGKLTSPLTLAEFKLAIRSTVQSDEFPEGGNARIALIVGNEVGFSMTRMYESLDLNPGIPIFCYSRRMDYWCFRPMAAR